MEPWEITQASSGASREIEIKSRGKSEWRYYFWRYQISAFPKGSGCAQAVEKIVIYKCAKNSSGRQTERGEITDWTDVSRSECCFNMAYENPHVDDDTGSIIFEFPDGKEQVSCVIDPVGWNPHSISYLSVDLPRLRHNGHLHQAKEKAKIIFEVCNLFFNFFRFRLVWKSPYS